MRVNIKKAVVFMLMTAMFLFHDSMCIAENIPSVEGNNTEQTATVLPPEILPTTTNSPTATPKPVPTRVPEPSVRFSRAFSTQYAEKGDEVTLSYTVRNEGVLTIRNIVVQDGLVGEVAQISHLAPGERRTVSTRVAVENTTSSTPSLSYEYNGKTYSKRLAAGEIKQVNVRMRLELASDKENVAPGELVTLRLRVINEGDVNLYGLRAIEPMLGELGNIVSILPPGEEYVLTRTVPMKGSATFRFKVSGSSETGTPFEMQSNEKSVMVTPVASQIRLTLEAEADKIVLDAPGEVCFWLYVDNECSLELRDVLLSEQTHGEIRNLAFVPTGKMPPIAQYYTVTTSGIYRFMAQVSDSVGDRMTVYSQPIYITVNENPQETKQPAETATANLSNLRETYIPLHDGQPYRMQEDTATFEKLMMGTVFVLLLTLAVWYTAARIREEKKRRLRRKKRKNKKLKAKREGKQL